MVIGLFKGFLKLFFIILLVGVFYLNNKAITGSVININEYADFSEDRIVIPVKVHVVRDDSGYYTSFRDKKNIAKVFEEVNRIWESGGIYFSVDEIVISETSFEAIPNAINGNYQELYNNENFNHGEINLFLTQN